MGIEIFVPNHATGIARLTQTNNEEITAVRGTGLT